MNNALAVAGVVLKELYRRKDFYVLFVLTALLTLGLASMNFFNDANIVRYLKEICLLLIWICSLVLTVVTTARQIPAEREQRTIFPLLAKPISRWELLLGKFLGCWLAAGLALLVFYFFFGLVTAAREQAMPAPVLWQGLWSHWIVLGLLISATLWGSMVLSTPGVNATIMFILSLGILWIGRHLGKVAQSLAEPAETLVYLVYCLIPHLEFFDLRQMIVHNLLVAPGAWLLSTVYGLAYMAFFLGLAWISFRRKQLS